MLKISHEVPLCLLQQSRKFNDFDYCLVHLLDQLPQYHKFFKTSLSLGREVLLDNSIFELGESWGGGEYAEWVVSLKPTIYILPDVLNDKDFTLNKSFQFLNDFKKLPGKPMGVIQGETILELIQCFIQMKQKVEYIAIPFRSPAYDEVCMQHYTNKSSLERQTLGRQYLVTQLWNKGLLEDPNLKVHLLGCSLPQEFKFYNRPAFKAIKSVDTSSPIIHTHKNISFTEYGELFEKDPLKLHTIMEAPIETFKPTLLKYNIKMFRSNCGGNYE